MNAGTYEAPKRSMIRYSDLEWELLAKAMWAEWTATPANLGLSIVQIANQAQITQKAILLCGETDPTVQWPQRHFTAVSQLTQAMSKISKLISDQRLSEQLLTQASNECTQLRLKLQEAQQHASNLENKKVTLADFPPADILTEAAIIQAEQAAQVLQATQTLNKTLEGLRELVTQSHNNTVGTVTKAITEAQASMASKAEQDITAVAAQLLTAVRELKPVAGQVHTTPHGKTLAEKFGKRSR